MADESASAPHPLDPWLKNQVSLIGTMPALKDLFSEQTAALVDISAATMVQNSAAALASFVDKIDVLGKIDIGPIAKALEDASRTFRLSVMQEWADMAPTVDKLTEHLVHDAGVDVAPLVEARPTPADTPGQARSKVAMLLSILFAVYMAFGNYSDAKDGAQEVMADVRGAIERLVDLAGRLDRVQE